MTAMHDWSLETIIVDWKARTASLLVRGPNGTASMIAHGLRMLHVPMAFEWGSSVSVNEIVGPAVDGHHQKLRIVIQSGDTIEIIADKFEMPQ
jgi:hypothetical protein